MSDKNTTTVRIFYRDGRIEEKEIKITKAKARKRNKK
jgi:translation elongation factor EF-1alpha